MEVKEISSTTENRILTTVDVVVAMRAASISAGAVEVTKTTRVEAAEMEDLHSIATDPICPTIRTATQTTWEAKTATTWVVPKTGLTTKVLMALTTKENLLSLCANMWTMTILHSSMGRVKDWTLDSSQLHSRLKCSSRPNNSFRCKCFTISRVEAIRVA